LITIEQRDSIVDDFIPTEEFLDFKKIEWEDIPDE
jgi:hypothetical protein